MNRIVICDDEIDDVAILKQLTEDCCQRYELAAEVVSFTSGDECLEYLRKCPSQLLLLDIYLQDVLGCEVAKILRGFDQNCAIAFVTNSREYALDGFEVGACHYLLKPVTAEQIGEAFVRCGLVEKKEEKYLILNSNRVPTKVARDKIVYIEVYDKLSIIHLQDGSRIKIYLTLSDLENKLADGYFLRTHRSYLVNMAYIHLVETTEFILTTGEKVPIRQTKRKEIKEIYMDYLFSSVRGSEKYDR